MGRPRLSIGYLTRGWGVHDERWMAALEALGFDASAYRVEDALGDDVVASLAQQDALLAGPLDSVGVALAPRIDELPPVVGLSWGFDLADPPEVVRTLLGRLAGLVVDSRATEAVALAAGIEAARVTYLPWGVDLGIFRPDGPTARESLGIGVRRLVVTARAHEPIYRVDDVLRGFAEAGDPDAVLVVANAGSLTPNLQSLAQELGITAHFIGAVTEADLVPLLRAADAYVSAAEVDGTSVTLLQAMACGVPCVVSSTPGNLGWIDPRTGWLFEVGDVHGLAAGIRSALDEGRSGRAAAALRIVRAEADWHRNIARMGAALELAASRPR